MIQGDEIMQEAIQIAAALAGALGFALLFNIRGQKLVFAAIGGGLAWGVYLVAGCFTENLYLCGFAASVMLTLYAECMARVYKTPVTVFLVTAAIPLIPGGGLYRAMNCLMQQDITGFGAESSYTLLFAASMSAGITFTTMIFRFVWKSVYRQRRM